MPRRALRLLAVPLLLLASCTDEATGPDASGEIRPGLLETSLSIVDGNNGGGNGHFFWLSPLADVRPDDFDGTADSGLYPTVEICLRNATGDGCAAGAPLASFQRDQGEEKNRIALDDNGHYYAHWRMNDFTPQTDDIYRIRVVYQEQELGHADVIVLRQREIKAYTRSSDGSVLPISDRGAFKITFRIEEGALEQQFCDFDGDEDVKDCQAGVERAGDGEPTVVTVDSDPDNGGDPVAVVTAPDGVFQDVNGDPIPDVVVTAEVEVGPPSPVIGDGQEVPYFVEINTFPEDVYIDPNGPGVTVVVCQDAVYLNNNGIIHSELILYKVSDDGSETRRLQSVFGAPECEPGPAPTPAQGFASLLGTGLRKLLAFVGPEPLRARRLHGGLNTVITRDASLSSAFSTFGATPGPHADSSFSVSPAEGFVGTPVEITVQLRDARGELLALAGDTVKAEVVSGPSVGAPFTVTDEGGGLYTLAYTPLAAGEDLVAMTVTRFEGTDLGAIGTSPDTIPISCAAPNSLALVTVTLGATCATPSEVPTFDVALSVIQPTGTILANDGTHLVENEVVAKAVTIGEVGGATAVIQNDTARQSFLVDGVSSGTVIFENLDFVNGAPSVNAPGQRSASIRAQGTFDQLVIQDNTFLGTDPDAHSAVRVDSSTVAGASALIQRNVFTANRSAVVVTGTTGATPPYASVPTTVDDNTFSGQSARGVQYQLAAVGNLTDNDLSDCGLICVQYQDGSSGLVQGNEVSDCGEVGCIRVFGGSVDILDNDIADSTPLPPDPNAVAYHNAIRFSSGAVGSIDGNVIDGCGWGSCIQVAFEAVAEVRNNDITVNEADNTSVGILGYGGGDDDPLLAFPATLTVVADNVVTGIGTGSGAPGDSDYYALKAAGIEMRNATADSVVRNSVSNSWRGLNVFQNAEMSDVRDNVVDQTAFAVNGYKDSAIRGTDNDFTNWVLGVNDTDGTLEGDLQCSWWGTASGPSTSTPTPVGLYAPWAVGPVAGAATAACPKQAGLWYWDPASGGNGHYYELVDDGGLTWTAAEAAAVGRTAYGTVSGHLVTITDAAEQAFVGTIRTDSLALADWRPWIGLRDVTGTGGFAWVTGEPFSFTNWGGAEPNNIGSELYVEMFASGVWNNNVNTPIAPLGYLVEYPPATGGLGAAPPAAAGLRLAPELRRTLEWPGAGADPAREVTRPHH